MSGRKMRWLLVIGSSVLVGLALVACVALTWLWGGSRFASNDEQIYFTATSQRGTPITSDMRMRYRVHRARRVRRRVGAGRIGSAGCDDHAGHSARQRGRGRFRP